jgi:hypothetical protein
MYLSTQNSWASKKKTWFDFRLENGTPQSC